MDERSIKLLCLNGMISTVKKNTIDESFNYIFWALILIILTSGIFNVGFYVGKQSRNISKFDSCSGGFNIRCL